MLKKINLFNTLIILLVLFNSSLANAAATAYQYNTNNIEGIFIIGLFITVAVAIFVASKLSIGKNSEQPTSKTWLCLKFVMIFIAIFVLGCIIVVNMMLTS